MALLKSLIVAYLTIIDAANGINKSERLLKNAEKNKWNNNFLLLAPKLKNFFTIK